MKKLLLLLFLLTSFSTFADWTLEKKVDDFEETTNYFIVSDIVRPNKPMSFPWNKASAFLHFNCQTKSIDMMTTMDVFNLNNDPIYSGNTTYIDINVKADRVIHRNIIVEHELFSNYISFDKGQTERILLNANEVVIQLDHYTQGLRTYSFNMEGLEPLLINQCSRN